jgi:hypothetical protein
LVTAAPKISSRIFSPLFIHQYIQMRCAIQQFGSLVGVTPPAVDLP